MTSAIALINNDVISVHTYFTANLLYYILSTIFNIHKTSYSLPYASF